MATNFEPIGSIEPLSEDTLRTIVRSLAPIQAMILHIGDVDRAAGAGVIGPRTRCIWTEDGRRITFEVVHGGYLGSISDGSDPAKPQTRHQP